MKNKIFKPLFLALLLPILASCSIFDGIIASVALNLVFDSDMLLHNASLENGGFNIEKYETLPTSETTRADLTYGIEALALPKRLAITQSGIEIEIDFTLTFSEGAQELFYVENFSAGEASEETTGEATLQILYPVGTQTKPESIDKIADWINVERLIDLKKETSKDIWISITGKAKNKTKTTKFYFNLNSDEIALPGGGDVTIDLDSALAITEVGVETTLDLTLSPAEQIAGKTFQLQVMWVDPLFGPSQTGTATVSVKNLASLNAYDLTLPTVNELELKSNDIIASYLFTIKLKTGQPNPTTPLVVTIAATLAAATA